MTWGIFRIVLFLASFGIGLYVTAPEASSLVVACEGGQLQISRTVSEDGSIQLDCIRGKLQDVDIQNVDDRVVPAEGWSPLTTVLTR